MRRAEADLMLKSRQNLRQAEGVQQADDSAVGLRFHFGGDDLAEC
jgi:hypothetical protein